MRMTPITAGPLAEKWSYSELGGDARRRVEIRPSRSGIEVAVTTEMFTGAFMKDVTTSATVPTERIDELIAVLQATKACH